ncbi:unnamed protein product [Lepeophtheirus salmonis]|uniref:(salmon louse) hypothetical protein n=1 Tax=Lepeophtheirus salmonis TaxID=72036 RepID=A0A817FA56_LEPSM|nr:unnamed protein product [Lepeophtheirus salmonis]CAG9476140.1 unnamed protein product [Lepeophtheirus salmonis]
MRLKIYSVLDQMALAQIQTECEVLWKTIYDLYVDDLLTGEDSVEATTLLIRGLQELMAKGGFTLAKLGILTSQNPWANKHRYWIVKVLVWLNKVISKRCFVCKRFTEKLQQQMMSVHPEERINPGMEPFSVIGLDFLSPVYIRDDSGKKENCIKGWIWSFYMWYIKDSSS